MNINNEIQSLQIADDLKNSLLSTFEPFTQKLNHWTELNQHLIIDDASQTASMKIARTLRLEIKDSRVNIEKKRKELKEDSLNYGRAVDKLAKILTEKLQPIEQALQEKENWVQIQDLKKREARKVIREARLRQLDFNHNLFTLDLLNIEDDKFEEEIIKAQLLEKHRKEEAERLERERLEREAEERRKQEEIRLENERLKKEAEAREKEIAIEREKQRIENEKKQKELQERLKKEAEAREKERLANEKKLKEMQAQREKEIAEAKKEAEDLKAIKEESERIAKIAQQKNPVADFLDNLDTEYTIIIEKYPNGKGYCLGFKDGKKNIFNRDLISMTSLQIEIEKALYMISLVEKNINNKQINKEK